MHRGRQSTLTVCRPSRPPARPSACLPRPLKVAQTVGVYYSANAVGRMVGTLASGALYSYVGSTIVDGFGACLMFSCAFAGISTAVDLFLHDDAAPGAALDASLDVASSPLQDLRPRQLLTGRSSPRCPSPAGVRRLGRLGAWIPGPKRSAAFVEPALDGAAVSKAAGEERGAVVLKA